MGGRDSAVRHWTHHAQSSQFGRQGLIPGMPQNRTWASVRGDWWTAARRGARPPLTAFAGGGYPTYPTSLVLPPLRSLVRVTGASSRGERDASGVVVADAKNAPLVVIGGHVWRVCCGAQAPESPYFDLTFCIFCMFCIFGIFGVFRMFCTFPSYFFPLIFFAFLIFFCNPPHPRKIGLVPGQCWVAAHVLRPSRHSLPCLYTKPIAFPHEVSG